jgi:uncharacterized membrane protein YbhN (UPF0104 family)
LLGSLVATHRTLIRWSWFAGARLIRVGMVTKLAEVKQDWNTALLKIIEKEGAIGRLSEQLQSVKLWFRLLLLREPTMTSRPCSFFGGSD